MNKHKNHDHKGQQKQSPKRRPGREPNEHVEVQTEFPQTNTDVSEASDSHKDLEAKQESKSQNSQEPTHHDSDSTAGTEEAHGSEVHGESEEKTRLEFPFSETIREHVPIAFEVAEAVVDEWKKDGSFDNLPVGHPVAQFAAGKALRTAKEVEKKLEEKGVIMMAKIGIDFVKSKINRK